MLDEEPNNEVPQKDAPYMPRNDTPSATTPKIVTATIAPPDNEPDIRNTNYPFTEKSYGRRNITVDKAIRLFRSALYNREQEIGGWFLSEGTTFKYFQLKYGDGLLMFLRCEYRTPKFQELEIDCLEHKYTRLTDTGSVGNDFIKSNRNILIRNPTNFEEQYKKENKYKYSSVEDEN